MNGWEFLEEYHKLNDELKGYSSKPLTTKKLNEILKDFP